MKKGLKIGAAVVIAALLVVALVMLGPVEEPVERSSYVGPCYGEVGGAKWVAESGCEWEMQSGATLDVQSGATTGFGGNVSVTGTLDVDGATTLNSTLDVDGNLSSGTGAVTVTDNFLLDGAADATQLTVQGYTTQTNDLLVLEQSDGTDQVTVDNSGNTDVAGTLQYGSGNLYPLGYASSGHEMVCGSDVITGDNQTVSVSGLTTVTHAIAILGSDPGATAGDPFLVSVDAPDGTSGDFVVNVWQDDASAATAGATVQWCAIGNQ